MKINGLIESLKNKRNKLYDEEGLRKELTKEDYKELDEFILGILLDYQTACCSEEEDSTFAYHLVLLEMDRAKIYQMINK